MQLQRRRGAAALQRAIVMSSNALATTSGSAAQVAQTEDGPITLASLDYVERLCNEQRQLAQDLLKQVSNLQQRARELEASAGLLLTNRQPDWAAADRTAQIDAARALGELVQTLGARIEDLSSQQHHGLGRMLHKVRDKRDVDDLSSKLQSAKAELASRYQAVADQLKGPTGIAEADSLLDQAADTRKQMQDIGDQGQSASAAADRLADEVKRRKDVQTQVGFDALGIRADLDANGLRSIATNLVLKSKEIAAASVPATLCRYRTRTQYVGSSHGLSIPLGHGFRYRVSSFRGHPIQSQFLGEVDKGTLVVTNQRLVFLGSKRDVSTPLSKLLQVEPFSNAVGIARESKEARDIFLVPSPEYVVFYLQWVVAHQG